jgi:hypothetical protein
MARTAMSHIFFLEVVPKPEKYQFKSYLVILCESFVFFVALWLVHRTLTTNTQRHKDELTTMSGQGSICAPFVWYENGAHL